jgi:serine/threonine protein kinase
MIGKTLAHYDITFLPGKGRMGGLYRAKDQKLGRDVAIKVMPEKSARDAERVAPFERETNHLLAVHARAF